ncbi:MAG: TIGR01841 family phasin [Pseudomonadota bacterium]|nr:TIGR01841 family phasin [Pseudomonadota bacterium]
MGNSLNPFGDFTKMLGDMKLPGFDIGALVEMQKKNVEAVIAANRVAMDGVRAVIERQVQIAQASAEQAQAALKAASSGKTKGVDVSNQIEEARAAVEKAIADMRELSEMVTRSQTEAFEILNKRMLEAADEVKGQFKL